MSTVRNRNSAGLMVTSLTVRCMVVAGVLAVGPMQRFSHAAGFTGTYSFTGTTGDTLSFAYNGTPIPNLTVGNLTKDGVTSSSSSGNFRASNWALDASVGTLTGTVNLGKYFEFTLTAASGYTFDMGSLDFGVGRSGTGTRSFEWRSSVDAYGAPIAGYTTVGTGLNQNLGAGILSYTADSTTGITGNVLGLATSTYQGLSAITLRFYGYNSEQSGGTGGLQGNFTFSGTLNAPVGTTYTWTGTGSGGTWENGQQGSFNAAYANSGISIAEFGGTGETVTVAGAGVEAGQLQFLTSGYTLAGGTITLGLGTVTTDPSTTATISAPLTGTGGLTKSGDGTLAISGANTYTGTTTISAGTLEIAADAALGAVANDIALGGTLKTTSTVSLDAGRDLLGTGTLDIAPGTTLTVNGATSTTAITLANTGTLAFNNVASNPGNITTTYGSGTAVISGAVNFGAADKVVSVAAGTLEMSGPITLATASGTELTKEGAGLLVLSGSGSSISRLQIGRASSTTPTDGGTVRIDDASDLGEQELYFNWGTIEPTTAITSTIGVSLSSRSTSKAVIGGAGGNADLTLTTARAFGPTGSSGEIVLDVNNNTTFTDAVNIGTGTTISGWTVGGSGRLTLSGASPTLTAPITLADTVTLNVTGSTANNVTVGSTNVLTGTGSIGGILGGAGSVQPGASPGILAVGQVDPSGGTDFVLEFTGALPDYTAATASTNDVVRVTGGTPFVSSMTSSNALDMFLGVTSITAGNSFQGGFFTNTAADFTSSVSGATLNYYVLGDGNGTDATLGGQGYYSFANWKAATSADAALALDLGTIAQTAAFASGTVNGQAMVITAVPEPSTLGLVVAAAGLAAAAVARRRS